MKFLCKFLHTYLLFLLAIICMSFDIPLLHCQNLINNGSNIIINKNANLIVSKDYRNESLNTTPGKINIHGNMIVRGNWTNLSPEDNVFVNIENNPDGNIILDGNIQQHINGTNSTTFENLLIKNSDKILDVNNNSVKGILTVDAVLDLNTNKIIIDNKAPGSILYKSKYIYSETTPSEGYSEVQWNIGDAQGLYQIPFGSGAGANDLNLSLTTTSSGTPADGNYTFATYPADCINSPLPTGVINTPIPPENVADRYWIINPDYADIKPNVNIEFTYTPKDIDVICNPYIVKEKLVAQSYCKDCNNDWKTPGISLASPKQVEVTGVKGNECYAPWRLMSIEEAPTIFYPNAFTPDNNGNNDKFGPIGMYMNLFSDYKFIIFDRWGELIFQTNDINTKWDGTVKNSGKIAPEGVYVWVAKYNDEKGLKRKQTGRVTLLITMGDK